MAGNDILTTMANYNHWANRELLAAVRALPAGEAGKRRRSPFESILNTLNYPLVMDRMWWAHLHMTPPPSQAALDEVVFNAFEHAGGGARRDGPVPGRLCRRAFAGRGRRGNRLPAAERRDRQHEPAMMLMHMFNQNSYHRGFAVEMFSQVPAALPLIDLSIFMRGKAACGFCRRICRRRKAAGGAAAGFFSDQTHGRTGRASPLWTAGRAR